jgi:N-acetylglutamate synthase-like GNAT family acetyltransferase
MIRKARPSDIPEGRRFLLQFGSDVLLPRTLAEMYAQARDYWLFHDVNNLVCFQDWNIMRGDGELRGVSAT